jgi:REP element-mobilizing transposase RayT
MSSVEKKPSLTLSFPLSSKKISQVITSADSPIPHRGWHSRGYLPHWDHPGMVQSINFRLADSLPMSVISKMEFELSLQPADKRKVELRRRIEEYLDAGRGDCWLLQPAVAKIVQNALLYFDKERYRLLSWCVMPNHVHVLIETQAQFPLAAVLHSWKSFTGHEANKLLQLQGEFWQREYLDRFVRNVEHFERIVAYIEENPVKAGLAKIKTDWPWSSAKFRNPGNAAIPAAR